VQLKIPSRRKEQFKALGITDDKAYLARLGITDDQEIAAISGKKAEAYFKYRKQPVALMLDAPSDHPKLADAQRLSSYAIESYSKRHVDEVVVFYNHAKNVADQVLKVEQILPITQLNIDTDDEVEWDKVFTDTSAQVAAVGYNERINDAKNHTRLDENGHPQVDRPLEYRPSAHAVLDQLLPAYVVTRIYHALMDSAAGEQGARRKAMKSATDNAEEIINVLMRRYNQARQSAITTEITEIIGGAAALEDEDA